MAVFPAIRYVRLAAMLFLLSVSVAGQKDLSSHPALTSDKRPKEGARQTTSSDTAQTSAQPTQTQNASQQVSLCKCAVPSAT
jgi:hypothetical protein